ncbi:MAG: peptidoglycan-binding protein [Propionibacteriaceae bacterium]|nr:peptidoglycan-binding protein [Propionibacteriaceae bacterium]
MLLGTIAIALALTGSIAAPTTAAAASDTSKQKFISSLVSAAQSTQRKFGVPASVSIAQAIEASSWGTSPATSKAKNYFNTPCSGRMTASQYADLAEEQVGKPYVLGANGPARFDCSSLVIYLNNKSGVFLMGDDTASGMYNRSRRVTGSPQVGDMVFLRNNPARANGIGHMAVLTKKLPGGEWRIIEARGRAYGVVRSTLSFWKQRSYYAGLRRLPALSFATSGSSTASAASVYQSGCVTIGSKVYAKFSSLTDSFYANAAAITEDSAYKAARSAMSSVPKFVDALADVVKSKDSSAYAKTLNSLIDTYNLNDYNVVPISLVLESGDSGTKVTALQSLLKASGYSVPPTGQFDSATVSAVKKLQKAKKLEVDGQAGQYTLTAVFAKIGAGTTGPRTTALNTLLESLGHKTSGGGSFESATISALKSFQLTAGRPASGSADAQTWAALFMSLDSPAPKVTGSAKVGQTLSVTAGTWGPGPVALSYQWYRGDAAVSDANSDSYTVQPADAGRSLRVAVTGLKTGYTVTVRTSAATETVDNANFTASPAPKISGKPAVGLKLTATAGTWSPGPVALAYQWTRDGKSISGATASTYIVQAADVNAALRVSVTGTMTGYNPVNKTSDATNLVAKGTLAVKNPSISGTRQVGKTLTAAPGTWAPSGVALTYQWYRDKAKIAKATGKTYKLVKADKGKKISVRVRGTLAGYTTLEKSSSKTKVI